MKIQLLQRQAKAKIFFSPTLYIKMIQMGYYKPLWFDLDNSMTKSEIHFS